jgi:3-deoxy-7-phosphoheptulonate synthase
MWTPNSWKSKECAQNISYQDPIALDRSLKKLSSLPPLVSVQDIQRLKSLMADVAMGNKFLLQGGDCAEMFDYAAEEPIKNKLKVLLQMSLILTWGGGTSVVRIARMGGQYAKPRSNPSEIVDGKEIPTFKGEIINGINANGSHDL